MNRTEIEIKLNRERAWTLETWAAMPPDGLARGITTSKHDPEASWSAKDHLAHLAGIEAAFNGIIRRYIGGDPNPIGIMKNSDGTTPSREEVMTRCITAGLRADCQKNNDHRKFVVPLDCGGPIWTVPPIPRSTTVAWVAALLRI